MTFKSLTTFFLPDLAATHALGVRLGRSLQAGTVLLLAGALGSGKTSLVQGLGQGLGITDAIVSPTFTLINEYPEGRVPLYHLDLYRLQPDAVAELYLETYWQGVEMPLGIVAIEWCDRLVTLPKDYLQIDLTYQGQGRQIQITPRGQASVDPHGFMPPQTARPGH